MECTPSAAELGILTVLWRCGPSTVREVHRTLAKDTGYTSTLKQLQVMHEKGFVRRSERFRTHIYEAAVSKEEIQAGIAGDMLRRVFEGKKNIASARLYASAMPMTSKRDRGPAGTSSRSTARSIRPALGSSSRRRPSTGCRAGKPA